MIDIILVFAIIVFGSALQGFSGFGYGLTVMAALPFFIPVTAATVLASVSVTFISLYMVWRNREHIDLKIIIFPLIGSFLLIPLGVFLLNFLDEEVLKTVLGSLLILISLFFLLKGNQGITITPSKFNGILAGALGGTLTGMLTIGGPPLVLYFIHAARDKYQYKVSLDTIFLITSIYRLGWLAYYGNITSDMAPLLGGAVIMGLIGTAIGFRMMIRVDREVIVKIIYIIMILAGLSLIFL